MSPNSVDIVSFDNIFLGINNAKGMIFKDRQSGSIHIYTLDVYPAVGKIENFRGVQWYMMESKDFVSSITFILTKENNELFFFIRRSMTLRLSTKDV